MQVLLLGGNIVKTYQIEAKDLKLYEAISDYDKGKVNPFEKYNDTVTNTSTNSTNNTTSTNKTGDKFFNTVGK